MTSWTVLDRSHEALRTVVRGIPADAWQLLTPCAEWDVTQVLQHATGDQLGYAAALTGGPGPASDPFAPTGVLDDEADALAEHAITASSRAWAGVAADATDVPVPVPPGRLPAATGAGACALDAAVHAWDLAVATGQTSPLSPGLATALLPVARVIVEPLRQFGAYAAALTPDPADDQPAALLRYLGRRPDWQPPMEPVQKPGHP